MGMGLPLEVSGLARKAIHELLQFTLIGVKRGGRGAAGFLVQLRSGFESLGPRDGSPQSSWCADIFPQRRALVGRIDCSRARTSCVSCGLSRVFMSDAGGCPVPSFA